MDVLSMNTMRIVLVGMSALAALIAAVFGQWLVAAVLTVGVVAHGGMWVYLHREREAQHADLHEGVEALLRDTDA